MTRLAAASTLAQGDILGTYQLLLPVGAGGMGRVWAARRINSPMTQFVAVKTALEELTGDIEFERVFIDEARIASSIVHPNVCTIYELGAERSIPYLVMEWINGGSLHDILAASTNRRIDYYVAARIVARVCSGLHAAHELRDLDGTEMHVVHRDVSPQNILISEHGHVKIADFGVARAKGQLHKPTQTGELKGKLSYMAPEQLTTKTFDRRADIFALGCVLYQATTGQRPFHGADALETMYKLLETECSPPSAHCPDYPHALEAIVLRALSKDLSVRYQTAEEMERDLERFLATNDRLVTDRDIAILVTGTLGRIVTERSEALKAALVAVDQTQKQSAAGSSGGGRMLGTVPLSASQSNGKAPATEAADATAQTTSTSGPAWESHGPKSSSTRLGRNSRVLVVSAAVVVSALVGAGWLLYSAGKPRSNLAASAQEQREPLDKTIELRIVAIPEEAQIELDNAAPIRGPLTLSVVPSKTVHQIVASLSGYTTERRTMVFDRPQELILQLVPAAQTAEAPSAQATASSSHRSQTVQSARQVVPKEPQSTITRPNEPPSTRARKPKRSLDPNNPFSDP